MSIRELEPNLAGNGLRVGVVQSRFNEDIGAGLRSGCLSELARLGVADADITCTTVPGALELPLTLQAMAQSKRFDALVALGAVIRGSTPHFDYVAGECAKGVSAAAMGASVPVVFGVLTTDTIEQALERAGTKAGNKGVDAAMAAIEMAQLWKSPRVG